MHIVPRPYIQDVPYTGTGTYCRAWTYPAHDDRDTFYGSAENDRD